MAIVRVAMLPSLLTLGNFTCGLVAMVLCLHAVRDHTRAKSLHHEALPAVSAAAPPYEPGVQPKVSTSTVLRVNGEAPPAESGRRAARMRAKIDALNARADDLFTMACLLIFLGMFFDTLDGRVARMTGSDSKFGAELDSLADASTFGLAPAVLVATMWLFVLPDDRGWWGQVLIFCAGYAACAALRLARYNVEIGSVDRNYFHGLPSPGAAGCVASTALVLHEGREWLAGAWAWLAEFTRGHLGGAAEIEVRMLACYTLFVGFLMVTRRTFIHVPNKYLSGRRKFTSLVLAVFLAVFLVQWKAVALSLAFNGYVVWCLVHGALRGFRRRRLPQTEISNS